ncbi:transposase [Streptomyces sp. Caat 7-52]|uniref:transposase n=1 Tax=Streptomyces sp. Caat 7-52 TaxID=2949637 RepID=UPI0020355F24|nr:transposase [Streptomyces sp. Caat 7-52]
MRTCRRWGRRADLADERQPTMRESRHELVRHVCHGKRGTVHQAYEDGVEERLGALGERS